MRRLMIGILLVGLTACVHNPYGPGITNTVIQHNNCDPAKLQQEWNLHRREPVNEGASVCMVLGRFGYPDRNNITALGTTALWNMFYTPTAHTMYAITVVAYYDSTVAQMHHVPVGEWIVTRFTFTDL